MKPLEAVASSAGRPSPPALQVPIPTSPAASPLGQAGSAPARPLPRKPPSQLGWLLHPFRSRPGALARPDDKQPFIAVSPVLVRGRRPRIHELDRLKGEYGVKTIVNMEDAFSTKLWPWDLWRLSPQQLQRAAQERGMRMLWLPLSCVSKPTLEQVQRILDIMDDPAAQPVLLHCFKGFERTNFVIAMHRIFREGVEVNEAYCDMLAMGFRRPLVPIMHTLFFDWTRAATAADYGTAVGKVAVACMAGAALGRVACHAQPSTPVERALDELAA